MIKSNRSTITDSIGIVLTHLRDEFKVSEATIASYRIAYNAFCRFLYENGIEIVTESHFLDFIYFKTGIKVDGFHGNYNNRKVNLYRRPLYILTKYLETGKVYQNIRGINPPFHCPDSFTVEYECFLSYLSECGLAIATYQTLLGYTRKFILFLENRGICSSEHIEVSHLDEYLMLYKDNSIKYRGTILYALRKYLSFLYNNGYTISNVSELLPHLQIPRAGDIPHSWTKEELRKLLEAIDREDPSGKRNYAMLLLIIHTGLRYADVRNLRFNNINWSSKKISIVIQKTMQPLELPLLETVGWALIDYIKNGRPQSSSSHVFIRHKAPFNSLGGAAAIDKALHRLLIKADIHSGIKGHHGVHSLRNTLARNMLDAGAPLPIISQTLAHQNVNTTAIYLKIDIDALRKCALDPEEVLRP
jgi:site-specific recombinase XerD